MSQWAMNPLPYVCLFMSQALLFIFFVHPTKHAMPCFVLEVLTSPPRVYPILYFGGIPVSIVLLLLGLCVAAANSQQNGLFVLFDCLSRYANTNTPPEFEPPCAETVDHRANGACHFYLMGQLTFWFLLRTLHLFSFSSKQAAFSLLLVVVVVVVVVVVGATTEPISVGLFSCNTMCSSAIVACYDSHSTPFVQCHVLCRTVRYGMYAIAIGTGLCSGQFPWDVAIVDTLVVPDVPAGDYVLQLRWDCEETAQVWTHCSDIQISS